MELGSLEERIIVDHSRHNPLNSDMGVKIGSPQWHFLSISCVLRTARAREVRSVKTSRIPHLEQLLYQKHVTGAVSPHTSERICLLGTG